MLAKLLRRKCPFSRPCTLLGFFHTPPLTITFLLMMLLINSIGKIQGIIHQKKIFSGALLKVLIFWYYVKRFKKQLLRLQALRALCCFKAPLKDTLPCSKSVSPLILQLKPLACWAPWSLYTNNPRYWNLVRPKAATSVSYANLPPTPMFPGT